MPVRPLRIGTRASLLAKVQADLVKDRLASLDPSVPSVPVEIRSAGDRQGGSLRAIGITGVFTAALEDALRRGQVEVAVHSLKDLPVVLGADVTVAAVLEREDVRDACLTREGVPLSELPPGSRVGTSSPRREAMLLHSYPHLKVTEIRGNIDTRLKKLDRGEVDALVVAVAGLRRLGVGRPFEILSEDVVMPAPGQGAIGVETVRESQAADIVAAIDHLPSRFEVETERALLRAFGTGCSLPIGAHATLKGDLLTLRAVVFDDRGRRRAGERSVRLEDRFREAMGLARELGA